MESVLYFYVSVVQLLRPRGQKKIKNIRSSLNRKLPPVSSSIHCILDVENKHVHCRATVKTFFIPIIGKASEYLERKL
jgi:hypothetical protein